MTCNCGGPNCQGGRWHGEPAPAIPTIPYRPGHAGPFKCPECGVWWVGYEHKCRPFITVIDGNGDDISSPNTGYKITSVVFRAAA